jgi:hypothetical protein
LATVFFFFCAAFLSKKKKANQEIGEETMPIAEELRRKRHIALPHTFLLAQHGMLLRLAL